MKEEEVELGNERLSAGKGKISLEERKEGTQRRRRTVQELLDQVDVSEDHTAAAIALEVKAVEGFSARGNKTKAKDQFFATGKRSTASDGSRAALNAPFRVAGFEELKV